MWWRRIPFLALLVAAGCTTEPSKCGCSIDVTEGHLELDCGASTCLGGTGYLCVSPAMVTAFPAACAAGVLDAAVGCTPSCVGRVCGGDGCTGVCGACPANQICQAGACVPGACTRNCALRQCGNDGCGGSCGTCTQGSCTASGTCSCTPQCNGCGGSNGCGGTCTCPTGKSCTSGVCCVSLNGPCQNTTDCCNGGTCSNNTCRAIDNSTCKGNAGPCTSPFDCCSGRCGTNNMCECGGMGAYCRPGQNADCCSDSCGLVFGCN